MLALVFFSPALEKTYIFRDAFNLFYPYKVMEAPYLKDFSVSAWNPWETLGSSSIGELATCWFYPGNVLFMVMGPEAAFRLFITLHFILAAAASWLWLREAGASPPASACGSLSYTLSGYMLSQNGIPDMLVTSAFLPFSLFALSRFLRTGRRHWFVFLGASLAMPFLAGRAEGVIMHAALAAGWIVYSGDGGDTAKAKAWTIMKVLPAAGLLALALSMVQFLPSAELGALSGKGGGYDLAVSTRWSFHPKRTLEFFVPSPWGRFWPIHDYEARDLSGLEGFYPWVISHYMGIPILIGCVASFFKASWRKRALVGGAALAAVLYSMGEHGFIYALAFKLAPVLRMFRYPEKYLLLFNFIVVTAGAIGLDHLARGARSAKSKKLFAALAATSLAAAVFALVVQGGATSWATRAVPLSHGLNPGALPHNYFSLQVLHSVAALVSFLAAMALYSTRRLNKAAPIMMVLVAFLDLGLANHWVIPFADPEIYSFEPSALRALRDYGLTTSPPLFNEKGNSIPGRYRIMRDLTMPSTETLAMIEAPSRFERHRRWERHTLKSNFNFIEGIESLIGYTAAFTSDYDRTMTTSLSLKTMELFNVRFVICPLHGSPLEGQGLPVIATRNDQGYKIFELPGRLPRAYLVGRSVRVAAFMDNLGLVKDHDFTRAVLIENGPAPPSAEEETDFDMIPAEVKSYAPGEVRLEAESKAAGYLVLSDSFFPGWRAFIDGTETPIFKANYLVRAVRFPAGRHEVVFKYKPLPYAVGKVVSVITLLAGLVYLAISLFYKGPRNSL